VTALWRRPREGSSAGGNAFRPISPLPAEIGPPEVPLPRLGDLLVRRKSREIGRFRLVGDRPRPSSQQEDCTGRRLAGRVGPVNATPARRAGLAGNIRAERPQCGRQPAAFRRRPGIGRRSRHRGSRGTSASRRSRCRRAAPVLSSASPDGRGEGAPGRPPRRRLGGPTSFLRLRLLPRSPGRGR
jgi:hypothetical protein